MKLSLVRHGESLANAHGLDRATTTPLSENGVVQAAQVAERLAGPTIDHLYSSPHARARQTADAIAQVVDVPVEEWESLVEADLAEESFEELNERAASILGRLVSDHANETIVCVSHATMIEFLLAKMVFGEDLSEEIAGAVRRRFGTTNTGISTCAWTEEDGWSLQAFNDASHLGEQ